MSPKLRVLALAAILSLGAAGCRTPVAGPFPEGAQAAPDLAAKELVVRGAAPEQTWGSWKRWLAPGGAEDAAQSCPQQLAPARDRSPGAASSLKALAAQRSRLLMAWAAERRGSLGQAREHYLEVVQSNPQQFVALYRLGVIAAKQGDFAQAEQRLREALALQPGNVGILNDLGYCLFLQNRLDAAEEVYRHALELAPGRLSVCGNLGLLLGQRHQFEESWRMFMRMGSEAVAHAYMGRVYARLGELKEAESHYRQAISLDSNMQSASHALAELERARQENAAQVAKSPDVPTNKTFAQARQDRTGAEPPIREIIEQPLPAKQAASALQEQPEQEAADLASSLPQPPAATEALAEDAPLAIGQAQRGQSLTRQNRAAAVPAEQAPGPDDRDNEIDQKKTIVADRAAPAGQERATGEPLSLAKVATTDPVNAISVREKSSFPGARNGHSENGRPLPATELDFTWTDEASFFRQLGKTLWADSEPVQAPTTLSRAEERTMAAGAPKAPAAKRTEEEGLGSADPPRSGHEADLTPQRALVVEAADPASSLAQPPAATEALAGDAPQANGQAQRSQPLARQIRVMAAAPVEPAPGLKDRADEIDQRKTIVADGDAPASQEPSTGKLWTIRDSTAPTDPESADQERATSELLALATIATTDPVKALGMQGRFSLPNDFSGQFDDRRLLSPIEPDSRWTDEAAYFRQLGRKLWAAPDPAKAPATLSRIEEGTMAADALAAPADKPIDEERLGWAGPSRSGDGADWAAQRAPLIEAADLASSLPQPPAATEALAEDAPLAIGQAHQGPGRATGELLTLAAVATTDPVKALGMRGKSPFLSGLNAQFDEERPLPATELDFSWTDETSYFRQLGKTLWAASEPAEASAILSTAEEETMAADALRAPAGKPIEEAGLGSAGARLSGDRADWTGQRVPLIEAADPASPFAQPPTAVQTLAQEAPQAGGQSQRGQPLTWQNPLVVAAQKGPVPRLVINNWVRENNQEETDSAEASPPPKPVQGEDGGRMTAKPAGPAAPGELEIGIFQNLVEPWEALSWPNGDEDLLVSRSEDSPAADKRPDATAAEDEIEAPTANREQIAREAVSSDDQKESAPHLPPIISPEEYLQQHPELLGRQGRAR